jgi:hypothetical protein
MKLPQVVLDKIESLPDACKNISIQHTNTAADGRRFYSIKGEIWETCATEPDAPPLDIKEKEA